MKLLLNAVSLPPSLSLSLSLFLSSPKAVAGRADRSQHCFVVVIITTCSANDFHLISKIIFRFYKLKELSSHCLEKMQSLL